MLFTIFNISFLFECELKRNISYSLQNASLLPSLSGVSLKNLQVNFGGKLHRC